jgi:hypothetical protein
MKSEKYKKQKVKGKIKNVKKKKNKSLIKKIKKIYIYKFDLNFLDQNKYKKIYIPPIIFSKKNKKQGKYTLYLPLRLV